MKFISLLLVFLSFYSNAQLLERIYSSPPKLDLAGKKGIIFNMESGMDTLETRTCIFFQESLENYLSKSSFFKSDGKFEKLYLRVQLSPNPEFKSRPYISRERKIMFAEMAYIYSPAQDFRRSISFSNVIDGEHIANHYDVKTNEIPVNYIYRYVADQLAKKAAEFFDIEYLKLNLYLRPLEIKKLNYQNIRKLINSREEQKIVDLTREHLKSKKISDKDRYNSYYNLSLFSLIDGNLDSALYYAELSRPGLKDYIYRRLENFIITKKSKDSLLLDFNKRRDRMVSPLIDEKTEMFEDRVEIPKQRFLLSVVGIDQFADNRIPELKYTYKDADLVHSFYNNLLKSKPEVLHSGILGGKKATRSNILKQLNETVNFSGEDDVNIFYFATHGQIDPVANELYFLTYDSDVDNMEGTSLSQYEIQRIINRSKAKIKVIVFDACHSGLAADKGFRSSAEEAQGINRMIKQIGFRDKSTMVISSSSTSEKSIETEKLGQGVFTYFLVEGLKGLADENNNGLVTSRELFDYVYREVSEYTKGKQHPEVSGNFDNFIPLSVVLKK